MDAPKLEFPCDYPIKVVARSVQGIRPMLDEIVAQHAGELAPARISERASAQANFVSVTYFIRATGESQLAALFADLKQCRHVLLVL